MPHTAHAIDSPGTELSSAAATIRERRMSGSPARAWTVLIVAVVARGILLCAISLVIWGAVPAVWGWIPTTVSSDSMAPAIRAGDVVVAMPVDSGTVRFGQVLLVHDPDHADHLRLHRFVDVDDSGRLILRGDANPTNDSSHIDAADVVGVGMIRVPWAGLPGLWLGAGEWMPLTGCLVGAVILFLVSRLDAPYFREPNPHRSRGKSTARLAGAAGAVTLLALAGSTAPPPAYAAFASTTTNPASTYAALAAYPCLEPAVADAPFFLYRFTEASGAVAVDSSGNARPGALQGGTTRVAGSCVANASPALTLNGSTGFVSTTYSMAAPNVFSTEIWFKTSSVRGGKLIGFGNSSTASSSQYDRHIYMTNAGKVVFGSYPGSAVTVTSTASYNDDIWHHAVSTLSPAGMRLYVDGVLVGSNTTTTGQAYTGFWRIGYDNLAGWPSLPTSFYFGGTIDNAAVYIGTALTAAQVSAHYAAGH